MDCNHEEHIRVHDHSSGDQICTGCGMVLESFAFEDQPAHLTHSEPDPPNIKKLYKPSEKIRNMGHLLKLPDAIISLAITLLADAYATGFGIRDATITSTAASALYYACKIQDVDRAEIEITSNCGVTTKQLTVSNKQFRRALAASSCAAKIYAPANPVRLIPRFLDVLCSEPALIRRGDKQHIRRLSEDIGYRAGERGVLEGKTPECCCIAFIFRALQQLKYPEAIIHDVCARCGLTPNTIGNALSILDPAL